MRGEEMPSCISSPLILFFLAFKPNLCVAVLIA